MPRLVLLDDDEDLLETLSLALTLGGFDVLTATNGTEGLKICRRDDVDAVISDINMPGVDGFTLCRVLREEGRRLPIILLTSTSSSPCPTGGALSRGTSRPHRIAEKRWRPT
jgi:DNA-binding response OmpR family regulator